MIPPITGQFLFHPRPRRRPFRPARHPERADDHAPYTAATLARAIRDGIDVDGKPLSVLMPRYALDDAEMAALIGYLKAAHQTHVPGVSDTRCISRRSSRRMQTR